METSQSSAEPLGAASETPSHATEPRVLPPYRYLAGDGEPLLRELLAEAHARIRALEAALDRIKQAI